jgi:RNA polymerase sigma-70 factor (ECF subfamily)
MSYNNPPNRENRISSFAQLYEEHLAYVFRYINYRVGNQTVAEELTATVFEKALAAFNKYDKRKAAPQTWLISIARNTIIDHFRKASIRNTVPLHEAVEVASGNPSPQEETERKEEYERLQFCFAELAGREQEIVSLKFGAEFTNRNIASMLSISENNVGQILYRAICKLRSCVKDWLNGKG